MNIVKIRSPFGLLIFFGEGINKKEIRKENNDLVSLNDAFGYPEAGASETGLPEIWGKEDYEK